MRRPQLISQRIFLPDPYWEAVIAAKDELEYLAASTPLPVLDGTPIEEDFIWHA